MDLIWIAALMIGGTTLLGTGCGFIFGGISDLWSDAATAFAAGVMLSAAMFGLFLPAMEMPAPWLVVPGALLGMAFLRIAARTGRGGMLRSHPELMFVAALAMHKFPEGMAGGVGLAGDQQAGMLVAAGIAVQNLPEGVVMVPPMLNAGVKRPHAALIALATGLLNAAGVLAGALWGGLSGGVLPLALGFAGGAMLDVIVRSMMPQINDRQRLKHGEWIMMGGFLLMLGVNMLF